MTAPVFVDTNVLVYDRDERDRAKHERARSWMTALWRRPGVGVVGGQVLTEFYWTVTRKLKPGLPEDQARSYVRTLETWPLVPIDESVITEGWAAQDRYGFNFWDALIVAAARVGGCRFLLTEDLQHGQDLGGLVVVNPFLQSPDSVLE